MGWLVDHSSSFCLVTFPHLLIFTFLVAPCKWLSLASWVSRAKSRTFVHHLVGSTLCQHHAPYTYFLSLPFFWVPHSETWYEILVLIFTSYAAGVICSFRALVSHKILILSLPYSSFCNLLLVLNTVTQN